LSRGVLADDAPRLDFLDDADELAPERLGLFAVSPHVAISLAWVSASDNIHVSTPGSPVECSNVIPDRRVVEQPVADSRFENFLTVTVDLDVADRPESQQVLGSEQSATSAGK
jgi:hypothetical protein